MQDKRSSVQATAVGYRSGWLGGVKRHGIVETVGCPVQIRRSRGDRPYGSALTRRPSFKDIILDDHLGSLGSVFLPRVIAQPETETAGCGLEKVAVDCDIGDGFEITE
jgi:hypothetical protein